jgi:hypothetical protein
MQSRRQLLFPKKNRFKDDVFGFDPVYSVCSKPNFVCIERLLKLIVFDVCQTSNTILQTLQRAIQ